MRHLILSLGLVSVFLISCERGDFLNGEKNNPNILNKEYITTANIKEQLFYKKYYLKEALKEVQKMNINLQSAVNSAKSFTSAPNVILLSDIISSVRNNNAKFSKEDEDRVAKISNAFKDLDGSNYEISFYIPFAEKIEISKNKAIAADIYIFEQLDNSEQLAFEGTVLNEDGDYVAYDQLITEEMAESLAEEGRAVIVVGLEQVYTVGTGTPPDTSTGGFSKYFNINDMAIKQHKESWIGGRSEVNFFGHVQMGASTRIVNTWNWYGYGNYNFWNPSRKEVKNQKLFQINRSLANIDREETFPKPSGDNFALNYVIFESDNWPTGNRTVDFTFQGITKTITYRSSDVPYDYRSIIARNTPIPYIENEGIKYRVYYGDNDLQ